MQVLRCGAARALLACVFLTAPRLRGAAQRLPGHSIVEPPNINTLASDWFLGGTMVPTKQALVLSPGISNRVGILWSSFPLLTNNFETTMRLRCRRPPTRTTKEGGFAFWYSYENGTQAHYNITQEHAQKEDKLIAGTWSEQFKKDGMDMLFYRSKYNGLGVFFMDDDQATVSAIPNDGSKEILVGAGVPTYDAVKVDLFSGKDVTVKVAIRPDGATVDIEGAGKLDVKGEFKAGGYIGFTSSGGLRLTPDGTQAAYVELRGLEVVNHDSSSKGEDYVSTTSNPGLPSGEKTDVLAEASSFKDHRKESDAIKDLTNMVFKLVVETQPQRQQMAKAIEALAKRVSAMETSFAELTSELDKKTGHKLGEEFDAIKKELASLTGVATKDISERHAKLESLHADITAVHKKATSSDNIEKHLDHVVMSNSKVLEDMNGAHRQMLGVSIGAIAFVIIAGLSLYNKFRCWEKKHVL